VTETFAEGGLELAGRASSVANQMMSQLSSDTERGLRYSLLRLELGGLTVQDRTELLELGRLAIGELNVVRPAAAITGREDASPLAVAIAEVVRDGRGSKKALMLGAVFGAYAFAITAGSGAESAARASIVGAVAGGCALATSASLDGSITRQAWAAYVSDQPE
jgi:hypothetical protein